MWTAHRYLFRKPPESLLLRAQHRFRGETNVHSDGRPLTSTPLTFLAKESLMCASLLVNICKSCWILAFSPSSSRICFPTSSRFSRRSSMPGTQGSQLIQTRSSRPKCARTISQGPSSGWRITKKMTPHSSEQQDILLLRRSHKGLHEGAINHRARFAKLPGGRCAVSHADVKCYPVTDAVHPISKGRPKRKARSNKAVKMRHSHFTSSLLWFWRAAPCAAIEERQF